MNKSKDKTNRNHYLELKVQHQHQYQQKRTIHRDERGHILSREQIANRRKEVDLREKIRRERLKRLNAGELQVYMRSKGLAYESLRMKSSAQSSYSSFP